ASVLAACDVHQRMGENVRNMLKQEGLTMPEDLPVAESIKICEKRLKDLEKERDKLRLQDETK
ncbi:MAG: hypothetical protein ACREC6_09625, partial [Hyphomicrobiaceae bacterium]